LFVILSKNEYNLKGFDYGKKVDEITREHGIIHGAFYKWRECLGYRVAKELRRVKEPD
jgi:transposase-like protein